MPTDTSEQAVTHVGEHAGANVVVGLEGKNRSMGFLQWVGVVGIGTALLGWLVPKMWEQQVKLTEKMIENGAAQAAALESAADAIDDVGEKFEAGVESIEDGKSAMVEKLEESLDSQLRKLERIADAVEAKHETPVSTPPATDGT